MKRYKIKEMGGQILVNNVIMATTTISRMKGLMFASQMPDCEGFLIDPCNSIHTFFMKFNLDIAFISKNNEIVHIERNMKPWRATRIHFKSKKVLEMKAGTMSEKMKVGIKVEIECIN